MQPIQRTSPDTHTGAPAGIAGYLAALIDQQARTPALAAGDMAGPGRGKLGLAAPWDTNGLIWVEDDVGPGVTTALDRGVIVVAHGPGQQAGGRTYVISYPGAGSGEQKRILAVTAALAGMGWQVLARKLRRTATGNANTAVLVCTARPGLEQRLWLAEPAGARNQVEAWVDEGGAGDDARQ